MEFLEMENYTPSISREEVQRLINERKKIKLESDSYKPKISKEETQRLLNERNKLNNENLEKIQEKPSWLSRLANKPVDALANNPVTDEIINSRNQFVESAKQAATGLSEFGQDFSNLPSTLTSALTLGKVNIPKSNINFAKLYGAQEKPEGAINSAIRGGFRELPAFAGTAPLNSGKYALKAAEKTAPAAETFGKFAAEKIGQGFSKLKPTLSRSLEALERGAGSSFIRGEGSGESSLKGLEVGGAQLGLEALGKGAGLTGKAIYKGIQAASEAPLAKELLNNISSDIGKRLPEGLEAFKSGLGQVTKLEEKESKAWSNTEKLANESKVSPENVKYQLNPVLEKVDKKILEYKNDTSEKSKQIVDYLNRTKEDIEKSQNYGDIFKLGKNLNERYGNSSTKESRKVISSLIAEYKNSVNSGLNRNNLSSLKREWNKANKISKEKFETFYNLTSENNKEVKTYFSKIYDSYRKNPKKVLSPEKFRKDFIPNLSGKLKEKGTDKFEKLEAITGDKDLTKNELIDSIFNFRNKKIEGNDFLSTYYKLSDKQREYLFNEKQNDVLKSLENLRNANPDILSDLHVKKIINDTILKLGRTAGNASLKIPPLRKNLEKDLVDKYSGKKIQKPKKEKNELSKNLGRAVKSYVSSNQ